jgi:hypothetical protein
MTKIGEILQAKIKPKEKVTALVEAIKNKKIPAHEFVEFFKAASDVEKGTCADVMKHVSEQNAGILVPYIDVLIPFINYKAPRVKWGIPEAIGNLAKKYPDKVVGAIPYLLKNTFENKINTTVIRWCAAFGLTEIAKNNPKTRKQLLPILAKIIKSEENNGVKNVYIKAVKVIGKEK